MRVLISVSDKKGIVEFAGSLAGLGAEIISTGGTYRVLKEAGIHDKDQLHLLLRALGECLEPCGRIDLETVQHIVCAVFAEVIIEVFEICDHIADTHPVGQVCPFRKIRYQLLGIGARCESVDQNASLVRSQKTGDQLDQGSLAASVRTEKSDDLSGRQVEVDVMLFPEYPDTPVWHRPDIQRV